MLKIPYLLVDGIMLISATANGQEGFFAFDTGAMQTSIPMKLEKADSRKIIGIS